MADQKISELGALAAPAAADLFAVVDDTDSTTKKSTLAQIEAVFSLANLAGTLDLTTQVTGILPLANGGTGALLADPGADRIFFWDDSETSTDFLTLGTGLSITTTTINTATADLTTQGIVELATAAETTTGTDATRAVTPDGLAGSDYGKRIVSIALLNDTTDTSVGDGAGDITYTVPEEINAWNLVNAHASVETAGVTNTLDVQIHNVTQAADMLTTKITIDSNETTSYTAATAPVIDGANDDVATGDKIRFDIDAVHTTAAKGLQVILTFQLP